MDQSRLWELENSGWRALCEQRGAEFYREMLTDDVLIVVPGILIDRATFLASVDSEPWANYRIEDPHAVELTPDGVMLTYHVTASRSEGQPYTAWLTSTWVRRDDDWRMAFHQQTPDP